MILAGDIGASHARLGLFHRGADTPVQVEILRSRDHASLEQIIAAFRARHGEPVSVACLALPGPVRDGRGVATNLGWSADAGQLARQFGFPGVHLLNDLEAVGYGLGPSAQLETLQPGTPDGRGNLALLCAGTGLGEAGCAWDGSGHRPFATEGGHGDFAPRTDLERELSRELETEFGHVSVERVLSGPGLLRLYRFLCRAGHGAENAELSAQLSVAADPARIVAAGQDGSSARCALCLEIFAGLLAAEAGNLALKLMARGGVYLGGGVVTGLAPLLRRPVFLEQFRAKGRMAPLLEAMPLHLIGNPLTGLVGAARYAGHARP